MHIMTASARQRLGMYGDMRSRGLDRKLGSRSQSKYALIVIMIHHIMIISLGSRSGNYVQVSGGAPASGGHGQAKC